MKASKKSIHAKLYEFTYCRSGLPNNLCPYFWKLVWATIVFIPNFLIQIPALIAMIFSKNHGMNDCGDRRETSGLFYFALMALTLYAWTQTQWIKAMFNYYSYDHESANVGWIINTIILIGILIWFIRKKVQEAREKSYEKYEKPEQEKKPSIVIEFIKAKYNKYCPKIDWE